MEIYDQYGQLVGRESRRVSRTTTHIRAVNIVRLAKVEAVAEHQVASLQAVAYVGRRAMQEVCLLSQLEQQLALTVPAASGRLAAIADLTSLAISEIVADTPPKLRRA